MSDPDYLVAGQGLAGTVFALTAMQRGRSVLVVDPEHASTCSRVAAGLMNPLSGPRLALGENEETLWNTARDFYRRWEEILGARFFEERPILRLLTDAEQAERWRKRLADPRYSGWHEPLPPEWQHRAPFGGFTTKRCGRLDTGAFLEAARAWLHTHGAFRSGKVDPGSPAVWCLGHESRLWGPFQSVPIRPARGTILTIRAPGFDETRVIHAGKWIVPLGAGIFRVGSTYEWDPADASPSPEAREELSDFLSGFLASPWELLQEDAAIRPMANRGLPFTGRHPKDPRHILFNGLGSRGSLLAPWHAERLLCHMEEGTPLPRATDVARLGAD